MSVIDCIEITDVTSLNELMCTSDEGGSKVIEFQITIALPQYKLMTRSQNFDDRFLSANYFVWN